MAGIVYDNLAGVVYRNPGTVEGIFRDFKGRRNGLIKALTTDVEDFFHRCDPEKENLCLYGFPDEHWEVNLPVQEAPPELPEPALGINFARDGMIEKDWLALVAFQSDVWLLSVAFYFGARFGFSKLEREILFNMINELPSIFEVVSAAAKKQMKENSSMTNLSGGIPKSNKMASFSIPSKDLPGSTVGGNTDYEEAPELRAYTRPVIEATTSCIVLGQAAKNYELNDTHFNQLSSFSGNPGEKALRFIREFCNVVESFPLHGLNEDQLKMKCFPYTLKGKAKEWLMTLQPGLLTNWNDVCLRFMGKYYPRQKTREMRARIVTFAKEEGEQFHDAWGRFCRFQRACPHHYFPTELLNQFFYDGLDLDLQFMVKTAAGGDIGARTADDITNIFHKMATKSQQESDRSLDFDLDKQLVQLQVSRNQGANYVPKQQQYTLGQSSKPSSEDTLQAFIQRSDEMNAQMKMMSTQIGQLANAVYRLEEQNQSGKLLSQTEQEWQVVDNEVEEVLRQPDPVQEMLSEEVTKENQF